MGGTLQPVTPQFNRSQLVESRPDLLTGDPEAVLYREMLEASGIIEWITGRLVDHAPKASKNSRTKRGNHRSACLSGLKHRSAVSQPDTKRLRATSCRWSSWRRSGCGSSFMSRLPRCFRRPQTRKLPHRIARQYSPKSRISF